MLFKDGAGEGRWETGHRGLLALNTYCSPLPESPVGVVVGEPHRCPPGLRSTPGMVRRR